MGLAVLFITFLILLLSYRLYVSPKVNQNINPSWKRSTPARRYMDGINFFPTRINVLTGFQFRSISLDVIISPIIAVQFGWLPAILWLLFGVIFFGWVQDYLATIISVRSTGSSISQLVGSYFNSKSRTVILVFLLCYLLIIISQFGLLLATLMSREDMPFAIIFLVFAGFFAGFLIYRTRINLAIASLLSILIAVLGIWISSTNLFHNWVGFINQRIAELGQLSTSASTLEDFSWQSLIWILIIFAICYLAAILPTWRFAVPFNYVSAWIVIFGFGLAVIGLFLGTLNGSINAAFEIPPIVTTNHSQIGPIWPILFVTLSSGAVSGWHSLVSSYTTSHQVEKEPLVKPVTTKAIYGETMIVAIVIIFAATFGVSSGTFNLDQNFALTSGPATVFAVGMAKTWNAVGISEAIGSSFSAYLLTMMSISVLHLVIRYARIIQSELIGERFPFFKNPSISTLFIIAVALLMVVFGLRQWLWVLFAGANQLLASLVLLLASIWLVKQSKSFWWTFWPAIFLFLTGLAALIYSAFYQVLLKQLISNPNISMDHIIGSVITIIFALFFIGAGTYLFSIGLREFNQLRSRLT
ncbi:MAG: carbon starvation CstA family protein [Anaerolineales bacterium]|nr:carbon starvation protein A [Anaerolineales bacterium]